MASQSQSQPSANAHVEGLTPHAAAGQPPPSTTRDILGGNKLRMGTCGWSDPSIIKCGRFYPSSCKSAEQRLAHYSSFFSCVEVDTTTYAITPPSTVKKWLNSVDPGFLFHFKAFGLFCSQSVPLSSLPRICKELPSMQAKMNEWSRASKDRVTGSDLPSDALAVVWERYNEVLDEAYRTGKLGLVIFQFQLSFQPGQASREQLKDCRRRLRPEFDMAVEFRDRTWLHGDELASTCTFLEELGLTLIASDDLALEVYRATGSSKNAPVPPGGWEEGVCKGGILPIVLKSTVPGHGAYVRLHRRAGCERVLAEWEVSDWAERIKRLVHKGIAQGPVYFMWGTDHEDQPIINAKNLAAACSEECFDWKGHLQKLRRERGGAGGLLSFLKVEVKGDPAADTLEAAAASGRDVAREVTEGIEGNGNMAGEGRDGQARCDDAASAKKMTGRMPPPPSHQLQNDPCCSFTGGGFDGSHGPDDGSHGPDVSESKARENASAAMTSVGASSTASPVRAARASDMCASEKRLREIAGHGAPQGGGRGRGAKSRKTTTPAKPGGGIQSYFTKK